MKKTWMVGVTALLGVAVALGRPVLAQAGNGGATPGPHKILGQMKKMASYLGLTAAQKAQIKPIMKDTVQQVRAVRADTTLTPAEQKAKIKTIRQSSRRQILAVLTPAQKQKLAAIRQQKKAAGAGV